MYTQYNNNAFDWGLDSVSLAGKKGLASELVSFCNYAWTPFHAVEEASRRLLAAGFQVRGGGALRPDLISTGIFCVPGEVRSLSHAITSTTVHHHRRHQHLSERGEWSIERGGKYFFTRNFTTIVAFAVGGEFSIANSSKFMASDLRSPFALVPPSTS